jgi:hypothetical protein
MTKMKFPSNKYAKGFYTGTTVCTGFTKVCKAKKNARSLEKSAVLLKLRVMKLAAAHQSRI